jgi:hypothetical protein
MALLKSGLSGSFRKNSRKYRASGDRNRKLAVLARPAVCSPRSGIWLFKSEDARKRRKMEAIGRKCGFQHFFRISSVITGKVSTSIVRKFNKW